MENNIRQLKGSPALDQFKRYHKNLHRGWYACDIDLLLLSKKKILAAIDYKWGQDKDLTWIEEIAYRHLISIGVPVFVVYEEKPYQVKPDNFEISQLMYDGSWEFIGNNYEAFERDLRNRKL